ncbi:hypothetical protein ACQX6Q_20155 [Salmonella enterica]|uniref:hypothetical protein n=1 Tax=Salmonella enterica TaxID=28901 RepID=UPI000FC1144C|nr:hypothetical protein [Salmonella enterica subsp. enterica serovar Napoli]MLQ56555.1 hypothetical protein [Salmonella enterica subsp. enterica serovar Napoli]
MIERNIYTNVATVVQVVTRCQYLRTGMEKLFSDDSVSLHFIQCIDDLVFEYNKTTRILLVLDMSGLNSMNEFKRALDFLSRSISSRKIGVLVSQYNEYLTYYISRKLHGAVTFFNSHNLQSGLFQQNFLSWLKGRTVRPMRPVSRFCDERYHLTLKEWVALVIPLSGESIQEMSRCMQIRPQTLYEIRQGALQKIGINSYREFCECYLKGYVRIENRRIYLR